MIVLTVYVFRKAGQRQFLCHLDAHSPHGRQCFWTVSQQRLVFDPRVKPALKSDALPPGNRMVGLIRSANGDVGM